MTQHLKYGGSTATRTLNCPAWVRLIPDNYVDKPSVAAERGSRLHDIMERYYESDDVALAQLTADLNTDDRVAIESAIVATDQVLDMQDTDEYFLESFITMGENIGGSADMIAVSNHAIVIIDYKFGRVPVENDDQLLFYAACAIDTFGFEQRNVYTAIVQPAVSHEPIVQQHTQSDVHAFKEKFLAAVADVNNEPFCGDWCKYCPAAPVCPAKKRQVSEFLNYDPKEQKQLSEAMKLTSQMKAQITAVEAAALENLEEGKPVPGFKLVNKRPVSRWTDEYAVLDRLKRARHIAKKDYLDEKLKSPAKLRDLLDLDDLIAKESSGVTVVRESDRREAVERSTVPAQILQLVNRKP